MILFICFHNSTHVVKRCIQVSQATSNLYRNVGQVGMNIFYGTGDLSYKIGKGSRVIFLFAIVDMQL